jgi:hypothetical protein
MKSVLTTLVLLFSFSTLFAEADICGIALENGHHAAFAHNQEARFTFEYSTDDPAGVRIFGRPYTNGALTSNYSAHGSALNFGGGSFNGYFTITSGTVIVDEIRVRIYNADQSNLLREFWIPVNYHFGENGVNNITFDNFNEVPTLLHGEDMDINFAYNVNHPGGARIFFRPITDGELTPGYSASGSALFNGSGSGSARFTINSGANVKVDYLRVRVVNDNQSLLLNEFYIPVNWYWSSVRISNVYITGPLYPSNGTQITVNYNYETSEADGVRIFPRPFTNNGLTPGYAACGSGVYTGSGSSECSFTITANNRRVDNIRFRVYDAGQEDILLEYLTPVDEFFGDFPITSQIVACPPAPARLTPGEQVKLTFNYDNRQSSPARIFPRPMFEGELAADYAASGSPAYPTGNGQASGNFTLTNPGEVDQLRVAVTNENQSIDWATYLFQARYVFGNELPSSVAAPRAEDQLQWSIAPNPVADLAHFQLRSNEQQTVDIHLVNALGQTLKSWPNYELIAGLEQKLPIDVNELRLASGLYFVHLRGANYVVTEQLLVQ